MLSVNFVLIYEELEVLSLKKEGSGGICFPAFGDMKSVEQALKSEVETWTFLHGIMG